MLPLTQKKAKKKPSNFLCYDDHRPKFFFCVPARIAEKESLPSCGLVSAEAILDPAAFKTKNSKRSCCLPLINVSSSLPGPDLLSESFASRRKRLRREGRRKSFPRWEEEEGEKRSSAMPMPSCTGAWNKASLLTF